MVWWKNQQKGMNLRSTGLAMELHLANQGFRGICSCLSKWWKTVCKARIFVLKSYSRNFNCQAGNIGSAWKDQSPQKQWGPEI